MKDRKVTFLELVITFGIIIKKNEMRYSSYVPTQVQQRLKTGYPVAEVLSGV